MKRLVVLAFALTSLCHGQDRPNILWITAEDMSPNLGCWGDAYATTPHIDKLAMESVRYTHAFATAPVCSPSRSCLITGVYAQTLGTHQMRSAFAIPEHIVGWPSFLRKAGYYTTNNVKTDYNTSSEKRLVAEAWNASSAVAHWRNRPDRKQPFFAVFNDMTTHQSRSMVWPYEEFVEKIQSKLSPDEIHDPAMVTVPPYYPDTPVIRRTLARYHDCIAVMDGNTGALLKQLEEDGLADDTIVFFYSDHGAGLPRHKRSLHDSGMHVPLLVRFPEKYKHLAPAEPGESLDRLVSFVDFPPTVLSLLGLEIPGYMQGIPFLGKAAEGREPRQQIYGARDRIDEVFDFARSLRTHDYLYIRNYMPHLGWNQRSVYPDQGEIRHELYRLADPKTMTPAQWAYAAPTRPVEELYDVKADPHQIRNLARDKTTADVLESMRKDLLATAGAIRDLGYLPEFVQTDDSARNPPSLSKKFLAATRIGWSAPEICLKSLDAKDPALRYWGVIGAIARQPPARATRTALAKATPDPLPAIQIESAAARWDTETLARHLASEDPLTVLHAARAIELLGPDRNKDKDTRDAIRKVYDTWKDRKDTPLALFIRFSCEAVLGLKEKY